MNKNTYAINSAKDEIDNVGPKMAKRHRVKVVRREGRRLIQQAYNETLAVFDGINVWASDEEVA